MKKIISVCLLCVIAVFSLNTDAGTVTVSWQNPDKYSDIRAGNSARKHFRDNLFSELEAHLVKLAKQLPSEVQLKLKVTNLNLAGEVHYNFALHQDIRIVKSSYWPMMEFEYQLTENQQVVKSDTIKLKDMLFMDRGGRSRLSHDSYHYEKRILTDWFDKHLQVMLANWKVQQEAVMGV